MMKDIRLMKGNEAIAEAAIRAGADAYFGYPITPQSEVLEYLMSQKPEERTGMIVLQAESEVAVINMIYGGAGCGKKVMTSSSGPGISLMQEGISYIAGAELPCVIVNIERGGPGLGTIQPSQADYLQAVKGGGHGDYKLIVLAPASVQEMADFLSIAFNLAFKYRNPVMILSDGAIGQMMEKVEFSKQIPRNKIMPEWATTGKTPDREKNIITSIILDPEKQEIHNQKLQKKYREIEKNEVRFEKILCDDIEYLIIAFGTCSRVCQKSVQIAHEKGIKVGLIRPITLYPFPYHEINKMTDRLKGILTVEMNAGQMLEDVRLAVNGKLKVEFHGRMGGMIPTPEEVLDALEQKIIQRK
ncbi:MAG: 3-methyl-2-oxobutanoate dehydrogenase subunit VorB [Bacteroidales bacterium]|nr:3-methyl-2-oxobutanoate dehydrogenase subunit VorB [Bacteroidales bacterium]